MNAPHSFPIRDPNPWADFERAAAEHKLASAERVAKAFDTARKELVDRFGEPRVWTAEELAELKAKREAQARQRADDAVRGLISGLVGEA